MTINQESRLKMFLAVSEFLAGNGEITKQLPGFDTCVSELNNTIQMIKESDEKQKNITTGNTKLKNESRHKLVTLASETAVRVIAYATINDDKKLLDEVNFSISDLNRMTDLQLRGFSELLLQNTEKIVGSLAPFGISSETQKNLAGVIAEFIASLTGPRIAVTKRHDATIQLDFHFSEADAILDKMDALAAILKSSDTGFSNSYKGVRKIIKVSGGSMALKATIRESASMQPVKGAICTWRSNGLSGTKRSAQMGSFFIRNMKPGKYEITVKKEGYREKLVSVNINPGERSDLEVFIEKE